MDDVGAVLGNVKAFVEGYSKAQFDGVEIFFGQFSWHRRIVVAWAVIRGKTVAFKPERTHEVSDG